MNRPIYPPSAYNDQLHLKIDLFTWAIVAFIMRPIVVFVASITQKKADRFALLNTFYPEPIWAYISVAAAIPAMLLVFAWWKRSPEAPPKVRWLWHRGRSLIAASLILNIVFLALPTWFLGQHFTAPIIAQIGLCAIALYYVFRSARVRDTFADFPDPPST